MTTENETSKVVNRNLIYALLIVCFAIIAYGVFYSTNNSDNFSYLLGQNAVYALFVTGIFVLIFRNKERKFNAGIPYILILFSLMVGDLIAASKQEKALKHMASEVQASIAELRAASENEQGEPQRIEKKLDETSMSSGPLAEMELFIKSNMNKMVSLRNDYHLELEAIKWNSILDTERISEDKTLIKSKAIINNAKDILVKYRTKNYALFDEIRKSIMNLNISNKQKNEMLAGYDDSVSNGLKETETIWKLEEMILLEFENIINLLSSRNGSWEVKDGQILFGTEEDLNIFNSHIVNIQSLSEKQENVQNKSASRLDEKLNTVIN